MEEKERYGFIMCVCTGKCPGFQAMDIWDFINQVRGGLGKPACSLIPPGMPGYEPNLGKEYEFNVAKAKQLLIEAGYEDISKLPELKFQFSNTGGNLLVAQFLQTQLKNNLGINLTLEPMEAKAFSQLVNSNRETWTYFGWGADYPDPDRWLPELFGTNAVNNHTTYSNEQFDALARQAKTEMNDSRRLQLWADAQRLVTADAPIITLFYREWLWLMRPSVKGLKPTGMDGCIPGDTFFNEVYLSP